jgi:hypothetical protein
MPSIHAMSHKGVSDVRRHSSSLSTPSLSGTRARKSLVTLLSNVAFLQCRALTREAPQPWQLSKAEDSFSPRRLHLHLGCLSSRSVNLESSHVSLWASVGNLRNSFRAAYLTLLVPLSSGQHWYRFHHRERDLQQSSVCFRPPAVRLVVPPFTLTVNRLEVKEGALQKGDSVLIMDDMIASGSTLVVSACAHSPSVLCSLTRQHLRCPDSPDLMLKSISGQLTCATALTRLDAPGCL